MCDHVPLLGDWSGISQSWFKAYLLYKKRPAYGKTSRLPHKHGLSLTENWSVYYTPFFFISKHAFMFLITSSCKYSDSHSLPHLKHLSCQIPSSFSYPQGSKSLAQQLLTRSPCSMFLFSIGDSSIEGSLVD